MKNLKYYLLLTFLMTFTMLKAQDSVSIERCPAIPEFRAVYCVMVDTNNIKWVGTDDGVYKLSSMYDAELVTDEAAGLALARGKGGREWIGLSNGKVFSSDKQFNFQTSKIKSDSITCILENEEALWVGTSSTGLYRFSLDGSNKKRVYTKKDSKLVSDQINDLVLTPSGKIWVGTGKGVGRLIGDKINAVYEKGHDVSALAVFHTDVWAMGRRWMWRIDDNTERWDDIDMHKQLSEGRVKDVSFDNRGLFYLASDIVVRYDLVADTLCVYDKAYGFISKEPMCMVSDQENDIWVGTRAEGLFRIQYGFKQKDKFTAIAYSEAEIKCYNDLTGAIMVTVKGGKPPYQYLWNSPHCIGPNPQNIAAGKYTVTIRDADGKEAIAGITLQQPPALELSIEDHTRISKSGFKDGKATVKVTGGVGDYTYKWSNDEKKASAYRLPEGLHSVKVKDGNGCEVQAAVQILPPFIMPELDLAVLKVGQTLQIKDLNFDADSTAVKSESHKVLDEIALFLKNNENVVIEIGGHTNGIPPAAYCDSLSTERARNVAMYLRKKGIPEKRVSFYGYGKNKPIATNETNAGRARISG